MSRHQLQAAHTAALGGGRLDRHQTYAAADVEEGVVRREADEVEDLLGGRWQEPDVLCTVLELRRGEGGHPVPHLYRARGVDVADGPVPRFLRQVGDHQTEVGKGEPGAIAGSLGRRPDRAGGRPPPLLSVSTDYYAGVVLFFFFGGQSVEAEGGRDTWGTQHKNRNRDVLANRSRTKSEDPTTCGKRRKGGVTPAVTTWTPGDTPRRNVLLSYRAR